MVFYIGDGNGQTRGKAEDATRRGRWRYDTRSLGIRDQKHFPD